MILAVRGISIDPNNACFRARLGYCLYASSRAARVSKRCWITLFSMRSGGLSLVRAFKAGPTAAPISVGPFSHDPAAQKDNQGRLLVEIKLDGTVSLDRFRLTLISMGANITGEYPYYSNGAVSAYVPMGTMETLGAASGLNHVSLTKRRCCPLL